LVALKLNENIQPITVKGQKRWLLRFDRGETKNHSALAYELPANNVRRIERAMKLYEQPGGMLFPGTRESHKEISLFGKAAVAAALAVAATLIDHGLLDYAALWQQVAQVAGNLLGTGGV
jgi:hypothetical protein